MTPRSKWRRLSEAKAEVEMREAALVESLRCGAEARAEVERESEAEWRMRESGTETETGTDSASEAETESESEAETECDSETEIEVETEAELQPSVAEIMRNFDWSGFGVVGKDKLRARGEGEVMIDEGRVQRDTG